MMQAAQAYARTAQSAMSPREAEAALLMKAARQLEAIRDDWAGQASALPQALNFNQKVWTILAGAATPPESPLPENIKNSIAQLAAFVFKRMIDTMIEPKAEKLSALINVNQQIAAGLRA